MEPPFFVLLEPKSHGLLIRFSLDSLASSAEAHTDAIEEAIFRRINWRRSCVNQLF